MDQRATSSLYDEHYYQHGCGLPYERTTHWLEFFSRIADSIITGIQPRSVVDAGCAKGFLVEALRDKGVDAYGFDVSEYAIGEVREDIRPYCWKGSITDPLPRRYDLITCIEVLEHLPEAEAEPAVRALCAAADDILMSSTPDDFTEPTHFNVQPPAYWAALFSRNGFYHDVEFNASFLTPWAMRFRKHNGPEDQRVSLYEKQLWQLKQELNEERHERQQLALSYDTLMHTHNTITSSVSWRLARRLKSAYQSLAPAGTLRDRAWQSVKRRLRARRAVRRARQVGVAGVPLAGARSGPNAYDAWIQAFEPGEQELARQVAWCRSASNRPLISVVTPVYNVPPVILRETILSVLRQTYDRWELCLVDGGSTLPGVREMLAEYAAEDTRIRMKLLDQNLGIAGNSTEAVQMAAGQYVMFLDHDDTLAPNALYEIARTVTSDPRVDIIYCDEDKITEDGTRRLDPFFKPDWSPEMLLSANYLMHSAMRRQLFLDVGGFDPAADGTQDWDLMLRCTERTQAIRHIPRVLYHWRMMSGSTAAEFTAKPYVFDNQLRCVADHLRRQGLQDVKAWFPHLGVLRVSWQTRQPLVSIIIPTKDNTRLVRRCLDSIRKRTTYGNFEIILVDTGSQERSTHKYYRELGRDSRVRIVKYTQPFNYSAANNFGATHATGDLLLFLNNDVEVLEPEWLEELVRWAERPRVGIVGAKLLYPSGLIQHAGIVIGMEGHASHIFWGTREQTGGIFGSVEWYRNYLAVTGACMMMRRQVFDEIGGFDETYQLVFSDVEICLRAADKGYRNVYSPFVRLMHHEGASRGQSMPAADLVRGYEHMRRLVEAGDPYFNANLSYASRTPVLARRTDEDRVARLVRVSGVAHARVPALRYART